MLLFFQFSTALLADLLFGDPEWFPHPVRIIGKFCNIYERLTRRLFRSELLAGFLTVFFVFTSSFLIFAAIFSIAYQLHPFISTILAVFFLYTSIAIKDLLFHSKSVYRLLCPEKQLEKARLAVGMIVGRDTAELDETGIARACVETVAENMVDGITAPIFYGCLGACIAAISEYPAIHGAALGAMTYKSINTMDSMFGYKNERYLYFGRVAARLDDIVNWLPARTSSFCLIFAAFLCKVDYRMAAMVYKRDRLNHSSPNAGHTEAVMAGALGIRLGGPAKYFGSEVVKPYIGNDDRTIVAEDIILANKLILIGSLVFFFCHIIVVSLCQV